ncbi:hypothetical protein AB0I22_09635 [Streptomyces sp. NPDC050610]|uniref:hypothetical protein n=1 Tax=Streptomyces sp. NPDC050610 TaxID=3157097 RepID=UPI00342E7CA7
MPGRWPVSLGVNLLLGVLGVVPVWLLWYFASNWPLAALGLTQREPTENDGVLPWLLIGIPVVGLYGLLWWSANRPLRRGITLAPRTYWLLSTAATLLPTVVLIAL